MANPTYSDPFQPFLKDAKGAFLSTPLARDQKDSLEYAKVTEYRRSIFDVIDRVEMLAFAFMRLRELSKEYLNVEKELDSSRRPVPGRAGTFEVSELSQSKRDRLLLEARSLTALIYYELASLANALGTLGVHFGGELKYAVKARNRFLAHPDSLHQPARRSASSLTVRPDGLLQTHCFNTAESDPRMLEVYLGRPFDVSMFDGLEEELQNNRKIILKSSKSDRLSTAEKFR